jgi:hypothetical protein
MTAPRARPVACRGGAQGVGPPVIYEVNTWVWLGEMERRYGRRMDLRDLPEEAWDEIAVPGADVVWLMGVWRRSPAGRAIALADETLRAAAREALPDARDDDITGSPYCVREYVAADRFGGRHGLATARAELDRRGLGLFLDYVPNHVAPDHPWVRDHPDYFVRGDHTDLDRDPIAFIELGEHVYARGRDPFFAPWRDVVQLDAFAPALRTATVDVLSEIGELCDGVRCDMAMLFMTDVFARTWGERAGPAPVDDFWPAVLTRVREHHPAMTFVAEAYWDLEEPLLGQGFDFCYDKRLYDRLVHESAESVRGHLRAGLDYQRGLVRFLENHDEPRAAATFGPAKEQAAAVAIATLPGATLWYEGQFEGRRVKIPVQLARRPAEPPDTALREFHLRLVSAVRDSGMRDGDWRLLECIGWADNPSHRDLVAWCWTVDTARHLVVVNLLGHGAQARIPLPWDDLPGRRWTLRDLLAEVSYQRDGTEMFDPGLYVDLAGWAAHVFAVEPGA